MASTEENGEASFFVSLLLLPLLLGQQADISNKKKKRPNGTSSPGDWFLPLHQPTTCLILFNVSHLMLSKNSLKGWKISHSIQVNGPKKNSKLASF